MNYKNILTLASLFVSGIVTAGEHKYEVIKDPGNCWVSAANKYSTSDAPIDPYLIYAIAYTESRFNPKATNKNTNGSYDIGLMQINSAWLNTLSKYNISKESLNDPCQSIFVGTWILANNFKNIGFHWRAIGAYNAVSENKRLKYAKMIYANYDMLKTKIALMSTKGVIEPKQYNYSTENIKVRSTEKQMQYVHANTPELAFNEH